MGRKADEDDGDGDGGEKGFFACYLLTSLNPRFKGQTYIGFTVNPRRRIRQHNGEIGSGAWRTKTKRPWEMVLCIHGFPTNVSALKFEWAWQHPTESLAVRQAAASFKSLSGLPNKIKLAYTMLSLPAWNSLNITVNYFSTKYKIHSAGCPSLPEQMKVKMCPMDELPCYSQGEDEHEHDCDDSLECDEDSTANEISTVGTERDRHYKTSGMQTWDAPTSEKVSSPPFSFINSPAEVSSSVAAGTSNATVSAEERDTFAWIEDNSKRQLRDSPEKDCTHPHSFIISSSVAAGTSNATVSAEESDAFAWIEDNSKRQLRDSPEKDCTDLHSCIISSVAAGTLNATVSAEESDAFAWIEDNSKRQLRDSPEKDCTDLHSCIISSVAAGTLNATVSAEESDAFAWIEDYSKRQLRDSPEKDCSHPHSFIISPARATMLSGKTTAGDRQATTAASYEDEPSTSSCNVSREIEIIDLFTPSPGCRVNSCSKKRKAMASFPDIIDLTKSPLFIQL